MRALLSIERRMQDLERKFENKERLGKVVAIKYEKDRWYVKMNDGQDQTPSGSQSNADPMNGEGTVKSDWQPWQSFSHGTMKFSVPPKVGQEVLMRAVGGMPELSTVEPFHYGPKTPSPHGKQDESVRLIHEKEDQQHWQHQTKDTNHLIIKTKQNKGAPGGLGDIGGLGDLANIGQMAGFSGADFSGMLGSLGNLGNLGNLAGLDISNIANLAGISGLGDISKLADFGSMAKMFGMPDFAQLGNVAGIAQQVTGAGLTSQAGQMIGGGAGGGAGIPASLGGQQKQDAPKLPDVPEEGDDGVTQVKSTKEFILKTVGKSKSYYRQDGDKVHLRFGEDGAKADVLMDENQVKIQFKDKKAVVKWTDSDLNVTFGEDKANIKLDDSAIVLTQGKDKAKVTIQEDYVEVKGASECSCGVDGRWVYINNGRVNLGVSGPKEAASVRVMTESGPSQVVWAKLA
ncbi:hypothetical protein [Bradyrhizobium sp. th.b2]|uniref:hypothetical protein n=1 Tax=Bradyrhizobium sp. th-b2 TaxID=172088 RepID=UPI00041D41E7|nr:hypothetical protein [Bradyrhizobium sp. th.b2]